MSTVALVIKIKRMSLPRPQQFQEILRLTEGSKRLILSTSFSLEEVDDLADLASHHFCSKNNYTATALG